MAERMMNADVAITIGREEIVLIRRAKDPYKDCLAFPGGKDDAEDETLLDLAIREVREELGIELEPYRDQLLLLTLLERPGRDPRPGKRASLVWWVNFDDDAILASAAPASDAKAMERWPIIDISEDDMAFDHFLAIEALRASL